MDDRFVSFRGQDGSEAEEFIQAVRRAAFNANKDRDDEWMARFASTCMSGRALRWYESLDDDVQNSWKYLRKAILARYPPPDEYSTVPSALAAPATPAAPPPPATTWPSSFPQVDFAPQPAAAPPPPAAAAGWPSPLPQVNPAPQPAAAPPPPLPARKWPPSFPRADFVQQAPAPPPPPPPASRWPSAFQAPAPPPPPPPAATWPSSFPQVDFAQQPPAPPPPSLTLRWPSSLPQVDSAQQAAAPSLKPRNKPFDGISGIIEIRYAETNRLMGYVSPTVKGIGAVQVTRMGRKSGQRFTVKNEANATYTALALNSGPRAYYKYIGLTWLRPEGASARASLRYAAVVFTVRSDGWGSSADSRSYEGNSEATLWEIAPDGRVTATSEGKPLDIRVYEENDGIYLSPDSVAFAGNADKWNQVHLYFKTD